MSTSLHKNNLPSADNENKTKEIKLNLNEKINLTTHNIRGLNNTLKMQNWIEHCVESDLYIISITETKLRDSATKSLTNSYYKIYTSNFLPYNLNQRETSLGTALMICNQLQPYIHNINTLPGTVICIDFFFPNNNKSRIISTYLPSNHLSLLKRTQSQILSWVAEARIRNWHLIIMGDFNANQYRNR